MIPERDSNGNLPACAWPGGYPIVYVMADGEVICPPCANGQNKSDASTDPETEEQWRIVDAEIHLEGGPYRCIHCGNQLNSAYGYDDAGE